MRFRFIDRIEELTAGQSITAVRRLSPDEDYLRDHFPNFPVMPGVLMLEAMFQTSAMLVRRSEDFAHAQVLLREARNVKYAGFVVPGQTLVIKAELLKHDERSATLKTQVSIDDRVAVMARLVLDKFNLADRMPTRASTDQYTRTKMRELFYELAGHLPAEKAARTAAESCAAPCHATAPTGDKILT